MVTIQLIPRKESIVLAAIDAINRSGIQAFTTREIARNLNISESIIFKHFPRKADLLLAVLCYFAQFDNAIIETASTKKMEPRAAITYFIDSYATYYENYPAITAIDQSFDILGCDNDEISTQAKEIFHRRITFVEQQIERAKKLEKIDTYTDSESLAEIIVGSFREICLKWRLDGGGFSLRRRILHTLNMLLDSFGLVI